MELSFDSIFVSLESKKGTRILLDGSLEGYATPGRLVAIMGPSGAGKSTLLHALAGRLPYSAKLSVEGNRYLNNQTLPGDTTVPAALVEQDVTFFPHMTVRETLAFRVDLQMGSQLSRKGRERLVNDLLEQMSLVECADTMVGNAKVRGVSGGERKRLSIAVEMISSPSIVFLDEPTTGLDSTAATTLVDNLRVLADSGKTVVAVIHQPSQHVFAKFDDLLLVSEGKLMYFGEVDSVRSYMEESGYTASVGMGTAEHILDCISRKRIEQETDEDVDRRMDQLARAAAAQSSGRVLASDNGKVLVASSTQRRPKTGILRQFRLLFSRSLNEKFRGKGLLILKSVQQITVSFVYATIYSLKLNQASIQDRFGLLSLIAIGAANMAVASAVRTFPKEKAIVAKELGSSLYRTLPYLIGKALAELPLTAFFNCLFGSLTYRFTGLCRRPGKFRRFLLLLVTHGLACEAVGLLVGAISPNSDFAQSLFPALMLVNIIFDGKNVSEENTPVLLKWVPKIGLIRWGFEGLAMNEFEGLVFETGGPRQGPVAKTGLEALGRFGLGGHTLADVFRSQLTITASCWLLSYVGLTLTRQKYQPMRKPATKPSVDDEPS